MECPRLSSTQSSLHHKTSSKSSSSSYSSSMSSSFPSTSLYGQGHRRLEQWNVKVSSVIRLVFTILVLSHKTMAEDYAGSQSWVHNQRYRIYQAWVACNKTIRDLERPKDGGLYCNPVWDNVMCWPNYTAAGSLVQQPCADYILGFDPKENAHRFCMSNGEWALHPDININTSWTNYLDCHTKVVKIDPDIKRHTPIVYLISTIGYSISLAFLVVAIIIMIRLKKLHCQRNTIHINLFLSFILRAVVHLVKTGLLDRGFAFSSDFVINDEGFAVFKNNTTHWECKLLNILLHYSLGANYTWIFVEGLYLHTLIFYAVFSQTKKFFKVYIIIGWCFPLVSVIIWIFVRAYEYDALCWNTHEKDYYWILETPIIVTVVINFFFFLNIIRVLFTKIRNCNTRDPRRFRKLAKSTLVLIPLFGVYYIVFIVLSRQKQQNVIIPHLYMEMILNSFQGIVVALLFCFFNGEVRSEISKRWSRHWLTRRYSTTSGRSSRAFSTSSFTLRERFSLSQIVSPTNDNKILKQSPSSSRLVLTAVVKAMNDTHNAADTIPRVPSESRVTFSDVDNCDYSSFPKGSQNGNLTNTGNSVFNQPEVGEQDLLLPVDESTISVNGSSKRSSVSDKKCDLIPEETTGLQNNSHSSSPMSFPASNGLSLVRDPENILQQNRAKKI